MSIADRGKPVLTKSTHKMRAGPMGYASAVMAVILAATLQLGLQELGIIHLPYLFFFPAVVLIAIREGFWPGTLAMLLATVTGAFLIFSPSNFSGLFTREDLAKPVLFIVLAMFLVVLTGRSKLAERTLGEREADLRCAQAVAHLGSWRHDIRANTLVLSDEACEIIGLPAKTHTTPEEMLDSLPSEDRESARESWTNAQKTGVHEVEQRVTVGGRARWVCIQATVERDKEGKPNTLVGTVQDITERKLSQERMQEYEKTLEGLQEMIVLVDRNYRYVLANNAFLQGRRLQKEQVIGRPLAELMGSEIFETEIKPKLAECFQGAVIHFEKQSNLPALGIRDFSVSYFPLTGSNGIEGAAIVMQDITERRRADAKLQEYERVVENLEDMIVVVDRNYEYILANQAFLKHMGMKKDQVVGRRAQEVVDPEIFEKSIKPRLDECFTGKVVQYDLRYPYPVLGERDLFISYFPIEGPSGIERVAIVAQDVTEKKHTDKSLRLFRTLIDHSNDAVEVVDPQTLQFLDVNEKACKDLGYSREEMLSMTVYDIDPEISDAKRENGQATLRSSGFFVKRSVHRRKDGSTFPVELSLRYVSLDRDYIVTFARDITKRQQAEDALRESVDRYRDLVENSEDLLCTHDLQGNLLSVNPAPARILGYSVEELLKIPMHELIIPEGREPFDAYLERLRTTGKPESGLLGVITRSGEVRTWEYYNTLRTDGVQTPIVRGMAHDVTDKRRAELALQQSEERFRFALKDSPVTVFNQDKDLCYTWVYNPPSEWPAEILGKTCEEVMGVKNSARLNELNRRVLDTGKGVRAELNFARNGHHTAFEVTLEPLLDHSGVIRGIAGSLTDVARLRELADRLEEQRDKLVREKSYLEGEIEAELGFEEIIGQSPALRDVLKKARVVAPTDSTVLLLGDTGTGKELVARALHSLSSRHQKNFIKLNCAAVPSGLLESELFGHEKGAFTSAVSQKVGRLELADGGTLFLDEVGELPPELQPKLLRVLQDREFERLGGVRTLRVDVRIISATNRDLQKDVVEKRFREDLFYRLNVFPIQLPPLRERKSDIPMLVSHFVRKYAARMGRRIEIIPRETMHVLQNWHWPGNVRELENMIQRMVILSKGETLAPPPVELDESDFAENRLEEIEREHLIRVLRETNGVLSGPAGAAHRLGMKRTTLQSMLKRFGIEPEEYRRIAGSIGTGSRSSSRPS